MRMPELIPPTKPHFFRPILRGSSLHLWIPRAFERKYLLVNNGEECEGKAIILKTYSGKSWTVKLKESKFQDGWSNFFWEHNLRVGDFVVFRYEGDLVFHVMIFDGSTCEIEYPASDVIKMEEKKRGREQKMNHKNKKIKAQEVEEKGEEICSSSRSKHPHFVATIKHYLSIPVGFARSNIPKSKTSIVVRVEQGRAWPVTLLHRRCSDRVSLGRGWVNFSVANGLKYGDVCLFELVNLSNKEDLMEFKVRLVEA